MRRGVKAFGWVLAFAACFAVGAVIAAHSDPFPPGVPDPGATSTVATSVPPVERVFTGVLRIRSAHVLYVGGACRTNWNGRLTVREDPGGAVSGTGKIRLEGGLACDFSVIQVQTNIVNVAVSGAMKGSRLTLGLSEAGRDPKASSDFGGLTHTLRFLGLSVPLGRSQQVHAVRSDGDRGSYTATGTFTARCTTGCA
jgi:hypothetical protein